MQKQKKPVSPLNIYTAIQSNKRRTAFIMAAFILFVGVVAMLLGLFLDDMARPLAKGAQGTDFGDFLHFGDFLDSGSDSGSSDGDPIAVVLVIIALVVLIIAVLWFLLVSMGHAVPDMSWLGASFVAGGSMLIALLLALWAYRKSDSLVLSISEAKPAERDKYPELFRTVENLCIGAGLPMPGIYIIDDTAPNAFATGRDPQHASIAVTSGLLQKMEKLELEGVIAHELSHIGNFDTRLMVVTAVLVGFIAILTDILLRLTWYGAGRRPRYRGKGEGIVGVISLFAAFIVIIIAPIVARLLQMAVSRQREYLADASAAMLTRYPMGLARALEKIAKDTEPLEVATKGTAHLYISNPLKGQESFLNDLFSTHPPVEDRIARLSAMAGQSLP